MNVAAKENGLFVFHGSLLRIGYFHINTENTNRYKGRAMIRKRNF